MPFLFLLAYICSGLAGLVYEVSWTRLLTLYIGHSTASASTVVAAFLGGLAVGASAGGRIASRLDARKAVTAYAGLEFVIAALAFLLPFAIRAAVPLLRWAYADGAGGGLFAGVRFALCVGLVFVPALALGATFPLAVRWFGATSRDQAKVGGALYALNTVGATIGSLLAGFTLIPTIGVSGTIHVGVAASLLASLLASFVAWRSPAGAGMAEGNPRSKPDRGRSGAQSDSASVARPALAAAVLGISGFASLVHEIAWTRILSLVLGPTTYAFAISLAAVVAGVAAGSGAATWWTTRIKKRRHPAALAIVLAAAALTIVVTSWLAGSHVPSQVAREVAASPGSFSELLRRGMLLSSLLIIPTSFCLGAAFPLALAIADTGSAAAPARFGLIYAVNTIGSVAGTLLAGFVLIPTVGLANTLALAAFSLISAAVIVLVAGAVDGGMRWVSYGLGAASILVMLFGPAWDKALLASGVYLYAPFVPKTLDLETQLKAGTLLYYKDGAPATVSVKRLTGTTTLAVDGKTDASNRSDMLTQKLVAHLPLLLHPAPRDVAIVGLGSGVTVGAALSHPVERVEVVEISPEVVEASRFFAAENHRALADPRTHLIVGDGRSHLLLSNRQYDVIISEPSNPWIAGVAALFTREFFEGVRARLKPGGLICQWAHTYTISASDLRSIIATFTSVFPNGTAWMVNDNDVLLVAGLDPVVPQLENIERHWSRGEAAANLAEVGATRPFHLLSLFAAGPEALAGYAANADLLDDDRMRLEFSAPRDLHSTSAGENIVSFESAEREDITPASIRERRTSATAADWRGRGDMMAKSDAHAIAYDDYVRALKLAPADEATLSAFVRTAKLIGRSQDAMSWVKAVNEDARPLPVLLALSKLSASAGARGDAIDAVKAACETRPTGTEACEQLASIYADSSDEASLAGVVALLTEAAPDAAGTYYYAGALAFLRGDAQAALTHAQAAIAADRRYAAAFDLAGAAHAKLGQPDRAAQAFQTSLQFDPHDSTAYTNLGLLALTAGQRADAINFLAEALWLTPDSTQARDAMARARGAAATLQKRGD